MPPQRNPASSLKAIRRSLSSAKSKEKRKLDDDDSAEEEPHQPRLQDRGPVRSLSRLTKAKDVIESIEYINVTIFDEIPERAGMNSVRIAEVLNFRKNLPPIVTVSHVHALSHSPTAAEREIAAMIQKGIVRRLSIPGRGLGSSAIGECLVLTDQWTASVNSSSHLSPDLKEKYLTVLREHPTSTSIPASHFAPQDISKVIQAGFLTSASLPSTSKGAAWYPGSSGQGSLSALASAGSRAPTGSVAAVGGLGAVHDAGGSGVAGGRSEEHSQRFSFTLPSVGLYLRLLASAREHLVTLLTKSRHREAPLDILRERWDGGVAGSEQKRSNTRSSQVSVLPGRTRKWKQYYGIPFQWILEECFGSGAIELFETGSVGIGARVPA